MDYEITNIQLFDYADHRQISEDGDFEVVYSYSANVVINDNFVVQIWGNESGSGFDGIADPIDVFWNTEQNQKHALNTIDQSELEAALFDSGFENNIEWLGENATEIINPENVQYR